MEKNEGTATTGESQHGKKDRVPQKRFPLQVGIDVDDIVVVSQHADEKRDRIANQSHSGVTRFGFVCPPPHDELIRNDAITQTSSQQIDKIDDTAWNARGA